MERDWSVLDGAASSAGVNTTALNNQYMVLVCTLSYLTKRPAKQVNIIMCNMIHKLKLPQIDFKFFVLMASNGAEYLVPSDVGPRSCRPTYKLRATTLVEVSTPTYVKAYLSMSGGATWHVARGA
eukprot:783629-Amphidinium_carterae.1